jgi:hypothetical protein
MPAPQTVCLTYDCASNSFTVRSPSSPTQTNPSSFEIKKNGRLHFKIANGLYGAVYIGDNDGSPGTPSGGARGVTVDATATCGTGKNGPNVLKIRNKRTSGDGCSLTLFGVDEDGNPVVYEGDSTIQPGGPKMVIQE